MSISDLSAQISPKFTEDVLKSIITNHYGLKEIILKNITTNTKSITKGDSCLSNIVRFTVEAVGINNSGETAEVYLPVLTKCIPKNVARRKTFRLADFFKTEITFYTKLWPSLSVFKKSKGILGDEIPLMLYADYDEINAFIALEDLSFKNYVNVNRNSGLSFNNIIMLIQLLANFHGLSLAYKDQNPEFDKIASTHLKEVYFSEKYRDWYINYQKNLMNIFTHAVKTQLPQIYQDKLAKLFDSDYFGTLCRLSETRTSLTAICQGDAWLPNFLVKFSDNQTTTVNGVLLDFQLARYCTLANDLTMFLYTCATEEILFNKWDELIETYHAALITRIIELGSKPSIAPLEDLKRDIQTNAIFGLGMCLETITFSMLEEDEVEELDLLDGEDAVPIDKIFQIEPFKDEKRNKRIAFVVKHAVDKGFIQ